MTKTKIGYWYCNTEHTIDISENEYILSLINNNIYTDERPNITHPNDEIDNKIRQYVEGELKKAEFYKGCGHAEIILIYQETENLDKIEKLHVINGSFSDEDTQKIIKQIKSEIRNK